MNRQQLTRRALVAVSLTAALALIAQSEWRLALAVGWPPVVAWLAPVALDTYALVAVLCRRDLGPAVLVSTLSVFASHALYAAPAAWTSGVPAVGSLVWQLAAGCSVVPLLVAWRVERIMRHEDAAETVPGMPADIPASVPRLDRDAHLPLPAGQEPAPAPQKPASAARPVVPAGRFHDQAVAWLRRNPIPEKGDEKGEWWERCNTASGLGGKSSAWAKAKQEAGKKLVAV